MSIHILGIESSCDDTSAAVISDGFLASNFIANQKVHEIYGGVIPELASRAHQQNIIPVVDTALKMAGLKISDISAVAFTRGPGLLGSLLVGTSFAKGLSIAKNIPMVEINHLQGHVLAHFIKEHNKENILPEFPFLCLLVSGGNTQIIVVRNYFEMEIIGATIDDAAGEAFDKTAKILGLPYPGGPLIDKLATAGNPNAFEFNKPKIQGLDYSFSGFKTSILYFIRDQIAINPNFIEENRADLCASVQRTIVEILMAKVKRAVRETGIKQIALAGGVSANSGLREAFAEFAQKERITAFIPEFKFTTDNAAMIAITGYYKFLQGEFASLDMVPLARMSF
ncbi:MAG TPA: tRNA (adenosine(37)-N6)-threonylcarbamoyltransferase complex transferase subunit TsaD [Bacteroidales bacterium]|nr:tRNA (adenosine(37)-N6)-threonylcarbamoyltransferase complex transferase subunit TsaD [Bacteroidales bacterium]